MANKLINVATNSIVTFSSLSKWSTPEDNKEIITAEHHRNFSFSTDLQTNPYVLLDLCNKYLIKKIIIFNRRDICQERAFKLQIEFSEDNITFNKIYRKFSPFNDKLEISIDKGLCCQYLKFSLYDKNYFHLYKIEVYAENDFDIKLSDVTQLKRNIDLDVKIDGQQCSDIINNLLVEKVFNLQNELQNLRTNVSKILKISRSLFDYAYGFETLEFTKAQLSADLWVIKQLNFKRRGFFVEFGAFDGVNLSNTYLLEKAFDWNGILAEPNKELYQKVLKSRNCICSNDLISDKDGEKFNFIPDGELGTIEKYVDCDGHKAHRNNFINQNMDKIGILTSISLNSFLDKYNAPKIIDYMSIDTEGSEFDILAKFDFTKYKVTLFTIEHNYKDEARNNIFRLMSSHGYVRINRMFDDWYINYELLERERERERETKVALPQKTN